MESFDNRFTSQVDFNIKSGRVLRKQSVNSDNNSPRSNDQSAHAIHRPTHNYSQQASQRREYTNGGRSFGDSYRRGRGGSQQSRGQY